MIMFFDVRAALAEILKQSGTPATFATSATQVSEFGLKVANVADVAVPQPQILEIEPHKTSSAGSDTRHGFAANGYLMKPVASPLEMPPRRVSRGTACYMKTCLPRVFLKCSIHGQALNFSEKTDRTAFPIRVRFKIPSGGFGTRLHDLHDWLRTEVRPGEYAIHSSPGLAMDAIGIHLRSIEGAWQMIRAFPDLVLADGTRHRVYSSPAHSGVWEEWELFGMCNLYSLTKGQSAIRTWFDTVNDRTGNLPPLPGIYPDYQAPVVWNGEDGPVLSMMRWGMPSPEFALKGKKTDRGVTNVRNVNSPHWRRWFGVQHRCVVPFTSFSEPNNQACKTAEPVWFALSDERPLAFFAGIWTNWTSVRKLKNGETTDDLFGFLTTDANSEVGAIHPKAMPAILTTKEEVDIWLSEDIEQALALQRPLPDGTLQIVAQGEAKDPS